MESTTLTSVSAAPFSAPAEPKQQAPLHSTHECTGTGPESQGLLAFQVPS